MFKVTIKTAERQLPCVKHKGALASSSSIFGRTLQFNRVCTITWNRPPINLKFKFFRSKSSITFLFSHLLSLLFHVHKQLPKLFIRKGILEIHSKFTGEHPCRSVTGNPLYWNHTSAWVFSCRFAVYFQNTFSYEQEHLWEGCLWTWDSKLRR